MTSGAGTYNHDSESVLHSPLNLRRWDAPTVSYSAFGFIIIGFWSHDVTKRIKEIGEMSTNLLAHH